MITPSAAVSPFVGPPAVVIAAARRQYARYWISYDCRVVHVHAPSVIALSGRGRGADTLVFGQKSNSAARGVYAVRLSRDCRFSRTPVQCATLPRLRHTNGVPTKKASLAARSPYTTRDVRRLGHASSFPKRPAQIPRGRRRSPSPSPTVLKSETYSSDL